MVNRTEAKPKEKRSRNRKCQHYWIIDTPKGPVSRGVCKYCGAAKEFQNYWQGSTWERDTSRPLELPMVPHISHDQLDEC